ncbi:MAG TPA: hypothetical protein VI251_15135, partial [Pseudolabrys sp.]
RAPTTTRHAGFSGESVPSPSGVAVGPREIQALDRAQNFPGAARQNTLRDVGIAWVAHEKRKRGRAKTTCRCEFALRPMLVNFW